MVDDRQALFQLLLIATPILLGILSFVGGLAVRQLMKMSSDLNDIKVICQKLSSEHESLEIRVEHLERKVFK
jgi:hypothetical protein